MISLKIFVIGQSEIEESYVTVGDYEILSLMPGAGAIVARVENSDRMLNSRTALIKDVVNNFLRC